MTKKKNGNNRNFGKHQQKFMIYDMYFILVLWCCCAALILSMGSQFAPYHIMLPATHKTHICGFESGSHCVLTATKFYFEDLQTAARVPFEAQYLSDACC